MVDRISARTKTPVRVLQQAADVLTGFPPRSERPLDVIAFGRQPTRVVDALARTCVWPSSPLLGWWSAGTSLYSKSTGRDRAAFLWLLRASKAALCYRFEDTNADQFQGVSPFSARWFEAAAAGAAIMGSQPSCPEADDEEMIETLPLPTDGEEAVQEIAARLRDGSIEESAQRNLIRACRYHDWRHRAREILNDMEIPTPQRLSHEINELERFAATLL